MRQIVLDTETTGLETSQGHRIIEIGCVSFSIVALLAVTTINTLSPNGKLMLARKLCTVLAMRCWKINRYLRVLPMIF